MRAGAEGWGPLGDHRRVPGWEGRMRAAPWLGWGEGTGLGWAGTEQGRGLPQGPTRLGTGKQRARKHSGLETCSTQMARSSRCVRAAGGSFRHLWWDRRSSSHSCPLHRGHCSGGRVPRLGLPPEAFPGRVHGKGWLGRPRGVPGAGHQQCVTSIRTLGTGGQGHTAAAAPSQD